MNGDESDLDCGRACDARCADGKQCKVANDCRSGVCDATLRCAAPTCADQTQNGDEPDVDCGGSCPTKCADGTKCAAASDCASKVCVAATKTCAVPTCIDGEKNGTETDTDCGGTCTVKCADGKGCLVGGDCSSQVCAAGSKTCTAPSCSDGFANGNETDVDCGGLCTAKCAPNRKCRVGTDCQSGVCTPGVLTCAAPACNDGIKNGNESDVDCGGSCATKCGLSKACGTTNDCDRGICEGTVCRAPTSCNERKLADPTSLDGAYTLRIGSDTFAAFCDMTTDGGGWTSVYKTSAGVTVDAPLLWTSASPVNETSAGCSDPASFGPSEYCIAPLATRYWNANGVTLTAARIHAYVGGTVRAFLKFGGLDANRSGWYGRANLAESSWNDITTTSQNFFSIAGDPIYGRTWFIQRNYGGCEVDHGWFVVSSVGGASNKICGWENTRGAATRILYSSAAGVTDWNSSTTVGIADVMMVFVR